jgi:hypothetical protein
LGKKGKRKGKREKSKKRVSIDKRPTVEQKGGVTQLENNARHRKKRLFNRVDNPAKDL